MAADLAFVGIVLQLVGALLAVPQLLAFTGASGQLRLFAARVTRTSELARQLIDTVTKTPTFGETGWSGNVKATLGVTILWWGPLVVRISCEPCPDLVPFAAVLFAAAVLALAIVITVNTGEWESSQTGWPHWTWPWPLKFVASLAPASLATLGFALVLPSFLVLLLASVPLRGLSLAMGRAIGSEGALRRTTAWAGFVAVAVGLVLQLVGAAIARYGN